MSSKKPKLKMAGKPAGSGIEEKFPKTDISTILKSNRANQEEFEKPFELNRKSGRRRRDYILVMLLVNMALAVPMFYTSSNLFVVIFCIAGMALFSVSFTWVMWSVLSNY